MGERGGEERWGREVGRRGGGERWGGEMGERGKCTFGLFINVLPEAICCCLQTCYVFGLLLTLPCTYTPTFMVTTANIIGRYRYI